MFSFLYVSAKFLNKINIPRMRYTKFEQFEIIRFWVMLWMVDLERPTHADRHSGRG